MGCWAWVGVTVLGAAVLAMPFLAGAILPWLGFGALGPVAGGIAASAQSWIGGTIVAGSIFAGLQSLAMRRK